MGELKALGNFGGALEEIECILFYKDKIMKELKFGQVYSSFLLFKNIVPAVWARAWDAAGASGAGKTAAMAWLVVCLFDVASTFTVAYAFVPGGEYFRERTDL